MLVLSGSNGLSNIAPGTTISFATDPTAPGQYELMTGNIAGFNPANFVLPAAPAGEIYALGTDAGNVDLIVGQTVPKPGTLALLFTGLLGLLAYARRRI